MNKKIEKEDRLTLELLEVVGKQNDFNQRHLARHMGVALGLANSYLKRCVRKGFIKIREAPANRYFYYLPPKGFAEKSRLTAQYLSYSFLFYRKAGDSCMRLFERCTLKGWNRVLLCGISDLTEIAVLRAVEADIAVIGVYDPRSEREKLLGRPVWLTWEKISSFDACLLTDLNTPELMLKSLAARIERERILVPDILGLEDR